jgi:predicted nuclease with TOPRIM domain
MSDQHLEEMREMRRGQVELFTKMSELCGQVRELVVELRHTQKDYELSDSRVSKLEADVRTLQVDSALNKPIMDIVRNINRNMWMTIIGAMIAVSASAVDWSKFMGN